MVEEKNKTGPQQQGKQTDLDQTEKDKEIKPVTGTFMIIVALLFDGIQAGINLIPIVGQILSFLISIFAFLTFWVWFKMNGVSFAKPKRAGSMGVGFLVELIPVLNMLPAWTLAVFLIISDTKIKKVLSQTPGRGKIASAIMDGKNS